MILQRGANAKKYVIALVVIALCTSFLYEFETLTGLTWNKAGHAVLQTLPPLRGSGGPGPAPDKVEHDDLFAIPPVNEEAIKSVCRQTQWNESLLFTCNESFGGIGNIRNSVLLCLRFAMQAGAALVLPQILIRDDDIANYKTQNATDFSYMFDTQHFYKSIQQSCPEMTIYPTLDEAINQHNFTGDVNRLRFQPESLTGDGLIRTEMWRDKFYDWLEQQQAGPVTGKAGPMVIDLERCYMSYPIYSDGEAFALSFGRMLQLRKDIRVMASKVLRALARRLSFADIDLENDVLPDAYFGAHLRVEHDAQVTWNSQYGWTHASYEKQAEDYLAQALQSRRSSPKGIYVASGDVEGTQRFVEDAARNNLTAVGKFDVLQGSADLGTLESYRWDQQALVDYLILLRASDFAGVAHSSFSWSIALKRHTWAKKEGKYLDAPEKLHDNLSVVYGVVGGENFPEALWP
ncbi:lternative oxidase [Diaporthe amygdali]|uniref:lternative oxidase n=1 Tax=Phomopsis amygdali TaxID=1214568 RepID=UPI0022FEB390|nr:lternative oxidase [Diaporthe amygdali]KAJ0122762.1 lternative oxidase [Diaporthe amygdali]